MPSAPRTPVRDDRARVLPGDGPRGRRVRALHGGCDILLCRALREHGVAAAGAPQAAQAVRSALHGFVTLEAARAFQDAEADTAFDVLMALLDRGLVALAGPGARGLLTSAVDLRDASGICSS